MNTRKTMRRVLLMLLALTLSPLLRAADFVDPLNQPARLSPLSSRTLLVALARAGERLVAVGQRGHIVYSDDQGTSWKQSTVPVSSDLTAVFFINEQKGWAVGHDGVVLYSEDRGESWVKQLDGLQANELMVKTLEEKVVAGDQSPNLQRLLTEAKRYRESGPDKPLLDVWFSDENNGYVVGAYNLILHTSDGGKHWDSWFDQTDNPNLFHLNAIRGNAGHVYVVGEQGLFLRLDRTSQRFVSRPTPYGGSFFSLAVAKGVIVAFGMRGYVYRTADDGESWQKVESGIESGLSGATVLEDGRIVAVSQAGQVLVSHDAGATFSSVAVNHGMPSSSVEQIDRNRIALSGTSGVQVVNLP